MRACPRRSSGETRTSCAEGLGGGVSDLRLTRVNCRFDYPFAPAEVVEFFREYCGPTTRAFATLEETLERIFSMSRSASLLPSIRVDDPMLSKIGRASCRESG